MTPFNHALVAAVFGTVLGATSFAANAAAPAGDAPTLRVKFAPSSLNTERGAREVYHRLVAASEAVCPAPSSDSHFVAESIKACRAEALATAVRQIDNSRLAALYAMSAKNG